MSNERHKQPTSFLTGDFHDYVEHNCKDRCSFLHYLGLLASSARVFGVHAYSVIEFVHGARTAIPRRMEPPLLFHHCHFRGCTLNRRNSVWGYWINLANVGIADTGFIFFILVPGYMPVWPSILGASNDFLDNRPSDANGRQYRAQAPAIAQLEFSMKRTAAILILLTGFTSLFLLYRSTAATPAAGAKAGATEGTFTTSDAIPWKPVDPKHPGLLIFAEWGNPNEGASEILQKFRGHGLGLALAHRGV